MESVPELPKQDFRLWLSRISWAHFSPEPVLIKQEQDLRVNVSWRDTGGHGIHKPELTEKLGN